MFPGLSAMLAGPMGDPQPGPEPIINGIAAGVDDYPMTGGVVFEAMGYRMAVCSSTLIAPDVVMLAAHCVDPDVLGTGTQPITFYWTTEPDLSQLSSVGSGDLPADAVAASSWVVHDGWSYANLGFELTKNYDVALLFLEEALEGHEFGYLPTEDEGESVVTGAEVAIVGWGQTSQGGSAGVKYWGRSPIGPVADYEFQVGPDEDDVRKCHGDSGGPSFLEVDTSSSVKERVVGIASHTWDESDCSVTGAVETRVDYYLDWIDDAMRDACDSGARVWCDEPGILPPPEEGDDELTKAERKALEDDVGLRGCSSVPLGAWPVGTAVAAALAAAFRRRRNALESDGWSRRLR
jgi:hypothetical protein